jgi:GT2 family glycosyltransferase
MPRLAVVIPVHNRRAISLACLERLRQVPQESFELKLYVVDDGSSDGTAVSIREAFPEVRLLQGDGSLWWSGAMNLGMEAALQDGAEYLLSLNDDTSFEPGLLPALLLVASRRP